ncbi:MAG: glycosyltransferase family 2 protein [Cypionkella sp.]
MMNGETVLMVTAMKNEGPYVLEWVAHHLALGVDGILVISNDCDDMTDRLLDRLSQIAPIYHRINPKVMFRDQGNWHVMALRYARYHSFYQDADWIYHTDADEFLQITTGDGSLQAFHKVATARAGRFDAVSFTSMPFNSSGVKELRDMPVVSQFTSLNKPYAQRLAAQQPELNAVKTMFRNSVNFQVRRSHRPLMAGFSAAGHVWIDGSANVMPPEYTDGKNKAMDATISTDLAQVSHYAIKSAEAFLIKQDRGDAAGVNRLDADRKYWEGYNTPGDAEPRFAKARAKAAKLLASFKADPLLAKLHAEAVAAHQAKAARLRADPARAAVVGRLGLLPQ